MKRLTIALAGLEEVDVERVRSALDRNDLSSWQLQDGISAEAADPDLLIVDVDSVWGHMDWLKSTARGQRTAGYSHRPQARTGDLVLAKPLRDDDLVRMLHALADAASHAGDRIGVDLQPDAATPAEPAADTAGATAHETRAAASEPSRDGNGASPADTHARTDSDAPVDSGSEPGNGTTTVPEASDATPGTVGEWLLSGASRRPFTLHDGNQHLLVDPQRGIYHGSTQLKPLVALLLRSPETAQTPHAPELAALDDAGQPIERLLWLSALIATPGRLSIRHDSATSFRLQRWPQIEREFPRHFRIATAMMKQPGSLGELASAANTPEADVADFINAYTATGHVIASDEEHSAAQSERPRLRKLFARGTNR